jgi:DNA invertase Pin-like site-specific DNA recombinase
MVSEETLVEEVKTPEVAQVAEVVKRGRGRPTNHERNQQMVKLYAAYGTLQSVANVFHCTAPNVYVVLKRMGVEMTKRKSHKH